jgi:hypothetical protein
MKENNVIRQLWISAVLVLVLALSVSAAKEASFEFVTTLDSAKAMSAGEKPILLDFYTDW